jgi:hypothetical protein
MQAGHFQRMTTSLVLTVGTHNGRLVVQVGPQVQHALFEFRQGEHAVAVVV